MVAKAKQGFPFYRSDTNKYYDRKIRNLKRKKGAIGVCVYDYLLAVIYGENGYYVEFSVDLVDDIADYWGIEPEEVRELVECCVDCELFDEVQYGENGVLTSERIQEENVRVNALIRRKTPVFGKYNLLHSSEEMANSSEVKGISSEVMTHSSEEMTHSSENLRNFSENVRKKCVLDRDIDIDKNKNRDKIKDNVVVVTHEEDADCIGKQQQLIDEDISKELCERYMFVNQRKVKALDIVDRFWQTNSAFGWRSPKHGKLINPEYAIRIWKPNAEEEGGYACKDLELVRKFYEFATLWGGKVRRELLSNFNDLTIEGNELQLTFHSEDAIDALEGLLIADRGAKEAFLSTFGVKMITYLLEE